MSNRTRYATLTDVLRLFELDLTTSDLGNEVKSSASVQERIRSHLEAAESEFESKTDNAFREVRVGVPGNPATYEYQEGKGGGSSRKYPIKVYLDKMQVVPLDSNAGDALEIRTARDTWKDITSDEGNVWRANYSKGVIAIHRGPDSATISLHGQQYGRKGNEEFARATYRFGATGGDQNSGGQTELDTSISDTDTGSTAVKNISRLPVGQNIFLLGNEEYVLATSDGTTFTIDSRGQRDSSKTSHDSGDIVHYCPLDIREAIASKAAIELLRQDDTLDILVETGSGLERNEKIRQLQDRWQQAVVRNDNTLSYG